MCLRYIGHGISSGHCAILVISSTNCCYSELFKETCEYTETVCAYQGRAVSIISFT